MKYLLVFIAFIIACPAFAFDDHIRPDGNKGYFTPNGKHIQSDGMGGWYK